MNIIFVVGDFREILLDNQVFDIVIVFIFLYEVKFFVIVLKEINRILKDRGLFLCIELEKLEILMGLRVFFKDMEVEMFDVGFIIVNKIYLLI